MLMALPTAEEVKSLVNTYVPGAVMVKGRDGIGMLAAGAGSVFINKPSTAARIMMFRFIPKIFRLSGLLLQPLRSG